MRFSDTCLVIVLEIGLLIVCRIDIYLHAALGRFEFDHRQRLISSFDFSVGNSMLLINSKERVRIFK